MSRSLIGKEVAWPVIISSSLGHMSTEKVLLLAANLSTRNTLLLRSKTENAQDTCAQHTLQLQVLLCPESRESFAPVVCKIVKQNKPC